MDKRRLHGIVGGIIIPRKKDLAEWHEKITHSSSIPYSSTAIPCDFLEKFLALKLEFLLKLRETNRWAWTVYVIATIPNWTQPVSLQKLHLSSVKDGLRNVIFQQCGCEKAN